MCIIYTCYYIYWYGGIFDMEELQMEIKKDAMSLLVEYSNQDNQNEVNEEVFTAYKKLSDTTQGECCCGSLAALCCCGI